MGNHVVLSSVMIYGYPDSTAENYAKSRGNEFTSVMGDSDGNGKVNIKDATLIQKHLAQIDTIEEYKLQCADTDKDGNVTIKDATLIQKFIAHIIPLTNN